MAGLQFLHVTGAAIGAWLEPLAALRMGIFREFPYLYEGSLEYEKDYLKTYIQCPEALAILLLDEGELIGVSTGLPMAAETEEFKQPLIAAGMDVETVFYGGESLILAEHRGRGAYRQFIEQREAYAWQLGLTTLAFCSVNRPTNHPLRPAGYVPLNTIWQSFGYREQPQLQAHYWWRDIDQSTDTEHTLTYWTKTL